MLVYTYIYLIIIGKSVSISFLYNIILIAFAENRNLSEYSVSPIDIINSGKRFGLIHSISLC